MSSLKFTPRASPVLAEHRTIYKISQVLLILHLCCRSSRVSLPKLQLFNWGMKTETRQLLLLNAAETSKLKVTSWGFDPLLTVAVNYAIAESLISITSTGYQLTDKGTVMVRSIIRDVEIMQKEKKILSSIGKSITEAMVDLITKSWVSA